MQPQKGEPFKRSKMQQEADRVILEELAECVMDDLNTDSQGTQEPFERYAHQLKMRLHQDHKNFSQRFVQGYEVLLEQLNTETNA